MTDYDSCNTADGILTCRNWYNSVFRTPYKAVSFSDTHYCAIMDNIVEDSQKTLSCSGVVLKTLKADAKDPLSASTSLADLLVTSQQITYKYFYLQDVRTEFDANIESVTCENWKTCVKLENGDSECWGVDRWVLNPVPTFFLSFAIFLAASVAMWGVLRVRNTSLQWWSLGLLWVAVGVSVLVPLGLASEVDPVAPVVSWVLITVPFVYFLRKNNYVV